MDPIQELLPGFRRPRGRPRKLRPLSPAERKAKARKSLRKLKGKTITVDIDGRTAAALEYLKRDQRTTSAILLSRLIHQEHRRVTQIAAPPPKGDI